MKYKVGDKVRLIASFFISAKAGVLGIIVQSYPSDKYLPYRVGVGEGWSCPVHEYEIEKIPAKGTQLLFSFMDEVT